MPTVSTSRDTVEASDGDHPPGEGFSLDTRFNTPLYFPGSTQIDQYLPFLLVLLSAGWIAIEMLRSNELGPTWVIAARFGVFWLLYVAIVWPISVLGSSAAGRKVSVERPPHHRWRVFASFAFPTALGYVLWTIVGGVMSFVTGVIVGLAIGVSAYYLLYRYRPAEAKQALPFAGGYYVGSLIPAVAALLALNFGVQQIMTASRTAHEFSVSPMGRYLVWNPPVPPPVEVPRALPPLIKFATDVPTTTTAPTTLGTMVDASPSTAPAVGPIVDTTATTTTQPTLAANTVSTSGPIAIAPSIDVIEPIKPTPTETPAPSDTLFGDGDDLDKVDPIAVPQEAAEFVQAIQPLAAMGTFDSAIFPAVPSRHVMLVRSGKAKDEDDMEIWSTNPVAKQGTARFHRDLGTEPGYLLSPDGKTITRIASFPALSIQVYSIAEARIVRVINLNKSQGEVTALGFTENNQLWLMWELGGRFGIEGWDVGSGNRLKSLLLEGYIPSPNNFAFSLDGRLGAFLRRPRQVGMAPEVNICNLRTGAITKRLQATGLDQQLLVEAKGLAFSADGNRIAIALEHQNQGLIYAWTMAGANEARPTQQHLFPVGFPGDRMIKRTGHDTLIWMPGGNAWLVNGTGLIDVTTGRLIYDIGQPKSVAQRVVDATTLELITANADPMDRAIQRSCQALSVTLKPLPTTAVAPK